MVYATDRSQATQKMRDALAGTQVNAVAKPAKVMKNIPEALPGVAEVLWFGLDLH